MKYNYVPVYLIENGISDQDAQILIMENIKIPLQKPAHKNKIWVIDNQTIAKFQMVLKEETWDTVYNVGNVNRMFNNFHCVLLRHCENSFPVSYKSYIQFLMLVMLIECSIVFTVSFSGAVKTVFLSAIKVICLMAGLQKVLKYHAKGKETFILYIETQITSK